MTPIKREELVDGKYYLVYIKSDILKVVGYGRWSDAWDMVNIVGHYHYMSKNMVITDEGWFSAGDPNSEFHEIFELTEDEVIKHIIPEIL